MTTFFLIRHAEPARVGYAGPWDPGLSPRGEAQAHELARRLASEPVAAVFSSPMLRARRTAEHIAVEYGLKVQVVDALRHIDFGEWRDLSWREIQERYPDWFREQQRRPHEVGFPGGEDVTDVRRRAHAACGELVSQYPEATLVVVCHDFVCRALVCAYLGVDDSYHGCFRQDMASLTTVEVGDGRAVVTGINDTCHLRGLRE